MTKMQHKVQYKFWATLFDAYQNYLDATDIYEEYWGYSENPPFTLQEFQDKQYQSLLDTINTCGTSMVPYPPLCQL